jgi:hypothetical protein
MTEEVWEKIELHQRILQDILGKLEIISEGQAQPAQRS